MSSASLATIAEAAGVTQSGLLYHFPCKDALLLSLLAEGDQPGTNPDVSGLAVIEELRELFRESTGSPGLVRLLTIVLNEAIATDHPAHLYVRNRFADLVSRLPAE